MNTVSELYRKAQRGEATPEELDALDLLEGINPPEVISFSQPLDPKTSTDDAPPSNNLVPVEEKCLPCEAHQKQRNES